MLGRKIFFNCKITTTMWLMHFMSPLCDYNEESRPIPNMKIELKSYMAEQERLWGSCDLWTVMHTPPHSPNLYTMHCTHHCPDQICKAAALQFWNYQRQTFFVVCLPKNIYKCKYAIFKSTVWTLKNYSRGFKYCF